MATKTVKARRKTAGGIAKQVKIGDIVVATGAHTDSAMNQLRIPGINFSAVADFHLVQAAYQASRTAQAAPDGTVHVGTIISRDYHHAGNCYGKLCYIAFDRPSCLPRYNLPCCPAHIRGTPSCEHASCTRGRAIACPLM